MRVLYDPCETHTNGKIHASPLNVHGFHSKEMYVLFPCRQREGPPMVQMIMMWSLTDLIRMMKVKKSHPNKYYYITFQFNFGKHFVTVERI